MVYVCRLGCLGVTDQLDALAHPASPVSSPQYNTIAIPTHHPDSSLSSIAPTAISPSGPLSHGQSTTSTSAVGTGSDNGVIGDKERERLLYPGRVLLTSESDTHQTLSLSSLLGFAWLSGVLRTPCGGGVRVAPRRGVSYR